MFKLVVVIACVMLLASCASAPCHGPGNPAIKVAAKRVDLSDTHKTKQILDQQYLNWRHVRYRMGGLSKNGIDCSGLVYLTYRTKFGIAMPRSTQYQSNTGRTIRKDQLRSGDLVFFKTGFSTRHVGMYIDKGRFLHVSTSKGVMISSLNNSYWASRYWKAQRVQ
jgi:probable lipoprotein NlpC